METFKHLKELLPNDLAGDIIKYMLPRTTSVLDICRSGLTEFAFSCQHNCGHLYPFDNNTSILMMGYYAYRYQEEYMITEFQTDYRRTLEIDNGLVTKYCILGAIDSGDIEYMKRIIKTHITPKKHYTEIYKQIKNISVAKVFIDTIYNTRSHDVSRERITDDFPAYIILNIAIINDNIEIVKYIYEKDEYMTYDVISSIPYHKMYKHNIDNRSMKFLVTLMEDDPPMDNLYWIYMFIYKNNGNLLDNQYYKHLIKYVFDVFQPDNETITRFIQHDIDNKIDHDILFTKYLGVLKYLSIDHVKYILHYQDTTMYKINSFYSRLLHKFNVCKIDSYEMLEYLISQSNDFNHMCEFANENMSISTLKKLYNKSKNKSEIYKVYKLITEIN